MTALSNQPGEISSGVRRHRLSSWREFIDVLIEQHADSPAFLYRGQAHDWPLLATIDRLEQQFPTRSVTMAWPCAREHQFDGPPVLRDGHLQAFKDASRGRVSEAMLRANDDEWWSLARHHGLATPILDWNIYPLVALYFAFEDAQIEVGKSVVEPESRFIYRVSRHLLKKPGTDGPGEGSASNLADAPRVFLPSVAGSARIVAQGAVCVFMPQAPWLSHLDLEAYVRATHPNETTDQTPLPRCILEIIEIASVGRKECLKFLNKAGINRMSMYPDLDGSARYINAMWELGFDTALGHFHDREDGE